MDELPPALPAEHGGAAIRPLAERGYTLAEVARHTEAVAEYTRALAFLDQYADRITPNIAGFARVGAETAIGLAHAPAHETTVLVTAINEWL
ncbi:hypothetical protein [Streptomyces sp. R08]|uniref:Uncharacterized protein n=1 Tax=Streptomyces sp. R08 TaxID=3238624 RepID=A0AB39MNA5_9ACTN